MSIVSRLTPEQQQIVTAMLAGSHLKVHRTMDGDKVYLLHASENERQSRQLEPKAVDGLERQGLLVSNMKFPAATFLLTEAGQSLAAKLSGSGGRPAGPRNF
jgi:hypothetical protein